MTTCLSLIAALGAETRGLGKNGQLLWRLPDDMRRFKEITTGHPVIMGRKTWESIPEKYRPLSGRTNIVVTRQAVYEAAGAVVVNSLEAATRAATLVPGAEETFIIGGGELYKEALPAAHRLYLTLVDDDASADTFFPEYEEVFALCEENMGEGVPVHRFLILERK